MSVNDRNEDRLETSVRLAGDPKECEMVCTGTIEEACRAFALSNPHLIRGADLRLIARRGETEWHLRVQRDTTYRVSGLRGG